MSFYIEKIVEEHFDFNDYNFNVISPPDNTDTTVFFELDPINFSNIYVWGIKTYKNSRIEIFLFHNILKKVIYQFPVGYDVCLVNDLEIKKKFDEQGNIFYDYNIHRGYQVIN